MPRPADYNGHTPSSPTIATRIHGYNQTCLLIQAPAFYGEAELVDGEVRWPRPLGTMSSGQGLLWDLVAYVNGYEAAPDRDDSRWGHLDDANLDVVRCALGYEAGAA